MHPIQLLRKKDPALRAALARRPAVINWQQFDELEAQRHAAQIACEQVRFHRRQIADQVAVAKRTGDDASARSLIEQGSALARDLEKLDADMAQLDRQQLDFVSGLPNAPHKDVPLGEKESDNRIVRAWSEPNIRPNALDHVPVAAAFGGIDAEAAAQLSGSRFAVMMGPIARLHRALIQLMLDTHTQTGYQEAYVPYLVKAAALFGTGQLPKFEDDLFKTQDDLYLIPTAEVPLTNLVANRTLAMSDLPLAWCAHTPCFRREAGSAGRDVKGLIRQHQFEKVELVRVEHPDRSEQALIEDVVANAQVVLHHLELPYRLVELCTADLGFASQHTFDLEVWLPSQNTYREISSCSNMGDFQARRMGTRLRDGANVIAPHTLNGSGLAVGRALVAVLENHIQPDGRLYVPERLRPYLGGAPYLNPIA
jgi:seryl-tRNA synthetase